MGHLVKALNGGVTQEEARRQLKVVHDFLVVRGRESVRKLEDSRSGWGSFAKRARVDLSGAGKPNLVGKSRERIVEVINMAATLERMLDALRWFSTQPEMREWLVLECHPSTSSTENGKDLVLGLASGDFRALCEVTDVVGKSAGQNGKELRDLKSLGCGEGVPTDGVRRFICTSTEFGEALSCAKRRRWGTWHYSYLKHTAGESMVLELKPRETGAPT